MHRVLNCILLIAVASTGHAQHKSASHSVNCCASSKQWHKLERTSLNKGVNQIFGGTPATVPGRVGNVGCVEKAALTLRARREDSRCFLFKGFSMHTFRRCLQVAPRLAEFP
jgi:hypothetical protein